ncbi:hypothetical protein FACS1894208_01450 [Clostridia bacterium]|nr:hypothetical protein FACS1894208_01450 [Clostridia bacterium]
MMFIDGSVKLGNQTCKFQKPNICPHCGLAIEAVAREPVSCENFVLVLFTCSSKPCKKKFFATYENKSNQNNIVKLEFISSYPTPQMPNIPESLVKLSPTFAQRCREAYAAEQNNHFEFAACGYRNAVEVLLKDYAVKYCDCKLPPDELRKLSVDSCIKQYLPDIESVTSAYFAKEEANKATHYPAPEDFSFDEFMDYFNPLIQLLGSRVRLLERSRNLPARHQRKFDSPDQ